MTVQLEKLDRDNDDYELIDIQEDEANISSNNEVKSVVIGDKTKTLLEWSKETGIRLSTFQSD